MSGTLFDDPRVTELLGGGATARTIVSVFKQVDIAEEEIATARDGADADENDPLWNAFLLLRATHDLMGTEFVYRAHCRELLARVAAGQDTRPATDAEIAAYISTGSLSAPLSGELVALQTRIFARTFPEQAAKLGVDLDIYEQMHAREANDWERELRHKLRQDWRKTTTRGAR